MSSILSPIMAVLQAALNGYFAITHDWGAAIILLTLSIRLLLLFANIPAARQQVIQSRIHVKMKELQEKYRHDARKQSEEMIKLYQEYGFKPLSMLWSALLQLPIFMTLYRLFNEQGAAMTSILIPWVRTLSEADHYLIIPILCVILQFFGFLIPLVGRTAEQAPATGPARMLLPILFSGIFFIFLWQAPVALSLYWTVAAAVALAERGFYRTMMGTRILHNKL